MGIYIIQSLYDNNWIKLGHHKVTEKRPNVYFRFINRGFFSCICPENIKNHVSSEYIQLLYWFPNLTNKDENKIHKLLKFNYKLHNIGEWYLKNDINIILNLIKTIGGIEIKTTFDDFQKAVEWKNKLLLKKKQK